jgi:ATP-dependent Clp protease ATP-binding subunit ClpC
LESLGVSREVVSKDIIDFVGVGPDQPGADTIPYTPRAKNALSIAAREAKILKHAQVGPEHIFLGLLMEGDGVAARVLQRLGVQIEALRRGLDSLP